MGIEHLPLLVDLDSHQEVMRHILGRARTTLEAECFWAPKCVETEADDRGLGWWVGFRDGMFVGWWVLAPGGIGATLDDGVTTAEAGWRLGRTWWGRGLATEGAIAVLRWGFEHADLEMVWAEVDPENVGSRGVVRHLGMKRVEAMDDADGSGIVDVRFEVSRAKWEHEQQRA